MRHLLPFLFLLLPLFLLADPLEDLDEDEANAAEMILPDTYLLDYCDCCDNAPLSLIYVEKVTRETCSYNSEKFSIRVEGPIIAVFQVDEWGKLKPGAQAGKERFSGLVSKNYTYVYVAGRGIPLGRRLYTYFDFCQGFVEFPSPNLLPVANYNFGEWYNSQPLHIEAQKDAIAIPQGVWRFDSLCNSYGDCQAIPGDNQAIWRIEGNKLTAEAGETMTGTVEFRRDMTGIATLGSSKDMFTWFLAPDNTLTIKMLSKGERSFLQLSKITRYTTALSGLRLRSAPTLEAPVTATLPYGSAVELQRTPGEPSFVTVEGFEGEMVFVRAGDKLGYVFSGFLSTRPVSEAKVITGKMAVLQMPDSLMYAADEYVMSPMDFNTSIDDSGYYFGEANTALEESGLPFLVTDARLLEFRTAAGKKFIVNGEVRGCNLLIVFDGVNAPSIHYPIDLSGDKSILNKLK